MRLAAGKEPGTPWTLLSPEVAVEEAALPGGTIRLPESHSLTAHRCHRVSSVLREKPKRREVSATEISSWTFRNPVQPFLNSLSPDEACHELPSLLAVWKLWVVTRLPIMEGGLPMDGNSTYPRRFS